MLSGTTPEEIEQSFHLDNMWDGLAAMDDPKHPAWAALTYVIERLTALAAERDAANAKQLTEADFRMAYQGYGRAIRREQDEPYPGEPYMSMDDAALLSAELVALRAKGQTDAE